MLLRPFAPMLTLRPNALITIVTITVTVTVTDITKSHNTFQWRSFYRMVIDKIQY
jgi:hypothetical protein